MASILLVDDEPVLTEMGARLLNNLGHKVASFCRSPEALAAFTDRPRAFDLVITDYMMPDMKGDELARRLHGIRQDIPVVLCSGYADFPPAVLKKWGIEAQLPKPYRVREMTGLVRSILDRARPGNAKQPAVQDSRRQFCH